MSRPRHTFLPMVNGVRAIMPVPCTPIKQFMGVEGFCYWKHTVPYYPTLPAGSHRSRTQYKRGWLIAHRALGIAARYDILSKTQAQALIVAEEYVCKHVREGETPQQTIERMIGVTAVRQAVNAFKQSAQSVSELPDWDSRAWTLGLGQGETAL